MKTTILNRLALAAMAASIAGFTPGATAADAPEEPRIAGKTVAASITVQATVEDVDIAKRLVTLKDEDGKITTLKVGPEVRNLPQVKKGDVVTAVYHEAIAYEVFKPGQAQPSGGDTEIVSRAKPGEKPAGGAANIETVTATIEAIDKTTSRVTLKGPQGNEITVKVKDPKKLEGVNVGDLVQLTYIQALAISVSPAPTK
jgi:hypothetical protein